MLLVGRVGVDYCNQLQSITDLCAIIIIIMIICHM